MWVSILARPASVFEWRGPSGRFFCSGERSRRGVVRQDARALTRIADVHYIVEKGRIVWTGTSAELRAREDVQHRYLGV